MNLYIRSDIYGPLSFMNGIPTDFSRYLLPQAQTFHAKGPWGIICFQEIKTDNYLLRHFLFMLQKTLALITSENDEGLQSLLNLKGEVVYKINGSEMKIQEKEFILLNAGREETTTVIAGGKACSLLNAYYNPRAYLSLIPLFPFFKSDLKKAARKPFHLLAPAKVARYSVHDAVQAIWLDRYIQVLEKKYIELKLESCLFTIIAQTYTESAVEPFSPLEREKAYQARELILKDIKIHLTLEQIAVELNCSEGWIKKAFSKVYGVGVFHFLRRTRMEMAKEMLLQGESLKVVALQVGMKPRNFPKEFKMFYGYTVTELKKGLR